MHLDRMMASGSLGDVVVCTDLSDKEPHRQVDIDRVMASWSLGDIVVCTDLSDKEPHRQVDLDQGWHQGA